jgi:hypothetical protein
VLDAGQDRRGDPPPLPGGLHPGRVDLLLHRIGWIEGFLAKTGLDFEPP